MEATLPNDCRCKTCSVLRRLLECEIPVRLRTDYTGCFGLLIQFQMLNRQASHLLVKEFTALLAKPDDQAADCVPMNAGQTFGGADRDALSNEVQDGKLPFAGGFFVRWGIFTFLPNFDAEIAPRQIYKGPGHSYWRKP